MPINREKDAHLRESAQEAWEWLRSFQPYMQAYTSFQKQSEKWPQQVLNYDWVSSIKNPAFTHEERVDQLSEYANISKKLANEIIEYRLQVESIWGFFPLSNLEQKELPKNLLAGLQANHGSDIFEPVEDITLQAQDSVFIDIEEATELLKEILKNDIEKGTGKPRRMIVTVDPTVSTKLLSELLTKQVQAFRKEHNVEENKSRPNNAHVKYIVSVLKNLEYSKDQARKELSQFLTNTDPQSKRQIIHRLLLNY